MQFWFLLIILSTFAQTPNKVVLEAPTNSTRFGVSVLTCFVKIYAKVLLLDTNNFSVTNHI